MLIFGSQSTTGHQEHAFMSESLKAQLLCKLCILLTIVFINTLNICDVITSFLRSSLKMFYDTNKHNITHSNMFMYVLFN